MIRPGGGNLKKKVATLRNRPPTQIFTQSDFLENKESE
nr:MAG TPA: hypothetical protein [Caudoviricetes sp.]